MDAERKILVVGNSHIWAIRRAIDQRGGARGVETVYILSEKVPKPEGKGVSHEVAYERIAGLEQGDAVFCSISGGLHNHYGLFEIGPAFEINGRTPPRTTLGVELIGESLLYHLFKKALADEVIKKAHRSAPCRTFHLAVRPPGRENEPIERCLAHRLKGRALLAPHIRLQMYQIETMAMRDLCTEIGTTFVEPPAEALDGDGFLVRDYWGEDTLHANEKYGELVLRQVEELCG